MKKIICIILVGILALNVNFLCSCQSQSKELNYSESDIKLAKKIYTFAEKKSVIKSDYTDEFLINVNVHDCDGEMYLGFTYAEKPFYINSDDGDGFSSLGYFESFYYKVTPQNIKKERLNLGLGGFKNSDKSCFWGYDETEEEHIFELYKIAQFIIGDGDNDT